MSKECWFSVWYAVGEPFENASAMRTDFLINERTFLAWIIICVADINLGFVVARFGLWLRQVAAHVNQQIHLPEAGASLPIGVVVVAFGGILSALATWRHHMVNRAIRHGAVGGSLGLTAFAAVGVVLLAYMMIIYIVLSAEHQ